MAVNELKIKLTIVHPFLLRIALIVLWTPCTILWVIINIVENFVSIFSGKMHTEISDKWENIYMPKISYIVAKAFIEVKIGNNK